MVNSPRSAVVMVAVWLAAVIGVSATAWVAIDRAGRDITAGIVSTLPAAPLKTPTLGAEPQPSPAPTTATALTTATPPTTVAAPPPVRTRSTASTPTPTPTPSRTRRHRRPPTRRTTSPPAPAPADRTINVTGGLVSVRCTGPAIGLRIAQPQNEWRVQVETYGTRQIHVTFTSGDEESVSRTEVSAECVEGTPTFRVTTR